MVGFRAECFDLDLRLFSFDFLLLDLNLSWSELIFFHDNMLLILFRQESKLINEDMIGNH